MPPSLIIVDSEFLACYHVPMFVRVKVRPNGKRSIQICESYRRSDKVSQKVVRHVGQAENDKEEAVLRNLANSIIVEMKNSRTPVLPSFS